MCKLRGRALFSHGVRMSTFIIAWKVFSPVRIDAGVVRVHCGASLQTCHDNHACSALLWTQTILTVLPVPINFAHLNNIA